MSGNVLIGIAGATVTNANLGCQALTYSAVMLLERAASRLGCTFHYVLFDLSYAQGKSEAGLDVLAEKTGIERSRLRVMSQGCAYDFAHRVYRFRDNLQVKRVLKDAAVVVDTTSGDSFSDIYGMKRLRYASTVREEAVRQSVPVILLPQTYGPFRSEDARNLAKCQVERASLVMARDELSRSCLRELTSVPVELTTDMAFVLPFEARKIDRMANAPKKVGINPSGLLTAKKHEQGFDDALSADYDKVIDELCSFFIDGGWELHLVSHVNESDYALCKDLANRHLRAVLHEDFSNPVDVKSLIATFDLFLGSRMHATIAALSSGVPVIPLAYSRKFEGLFGGLGYDHVVGLSTMSTEEAISAAESLSDEREMLLVDAKRAQAKAAKLLDQAENALAQCLERVLKLKE